MDQLGELICRVKNGDGESFEKINGWEWICRDFWKISGWKIVTREWVTIFYEPQKERGKVGGIRQTRPDGAV